MGVDDVIRDAFAMGVTTRSFFLRRQRITASH